MPSTNPYPYRYPFPYPQPYSHPHLFTYPPHMPWPICGAKRNWTACFSHTHTTLHTSRCLAHVMPKLALQTTFLHSPTCPALKPFTHPLQSHSSGLERDIPPNRIASGDASYYRALGPPSRSHDVAQSLSRCNVFLGRKLSRRYPWNSRTAAAARGSCCRRRAGSGQQAAAVGGGCATAAAPFAGCLSYTASSSSGGSQRDPSRADSNSSWV